MRPTAEEINERWGLKTRPGDDSLDAIFEILSRVDDRLKLLEKAEHDRETLELEQSEWTP